MNKKLLITGGAGYIGSHTVRFLIEKGLNPKDIIVFDNLVYGHEDFLPGEVELVIGDLSNKEEIEDVFKKNNIDSVIHFAAYAYVGESMSNPTKYFQNNIGGGLNLIESMYNHGCKKIVFSSTCATYGIPKTTPITEKMVQKPINPYGESKLAFEKVLEWYWRIHGIRSIRLRYFNACGASYGIGEDHNPETHLIPLVLKRASNEINSLKVFGTDYDTYDGTCVRDYIHVLDLAKAHFMALQYLDEHDISDYFNLGTGHGSSVIEIINTCKETTHIQIPYDIDSRRAGDPAILVASPIKANKILGWKSNYSVTDAIKDQWNYMNNKKI